MTEITPEVPPETDPIESIYQGECPTISNRSTLVYQIGRHSKDSTLHIRLSKNSGGGGMFCKEWASGSAIQDVVLGETGLTAKSFHVLHPGRSINTGGFVMAVLKDLGLIRANDENTRLHEHVPLTTFEQVAMARISESMGPDSKPARRKGKET